MQNYFELYHIPISFQPDPQEVKQQFYALSKQFHPDRFSQADSTAQTEVLQMAALNNEAYKTLSNRDKTMAYVLQLKGCLETEEHYQLPPDFLMEMMELNEAVSDAEDMPDNEDAKNQAKSILEEAFNTWEQESAGLLKAFESGENEASTLEKIKDLYFRKKYLLRIRERVTTFASR